MKRNSFLTFLKEKSFIIVLTLMLVSAGTMAALFTFGENEGAREMNQEEQPEKSAARTQNVAKNEQSVNPGSEIAAGKKTTDTKAKKAENTNTTPIQENIMGAAELEDQFLGTEDMAEVSAADVIAEGFSEAKLLSLKWPVQGEVLLPFSMDQSIYFETLAQYQYNPAMIISAPEGTEVLAAAKGTVTEVGKSNEYGHYISMDLGNGFVITYGQLFDLTVETGETVEAGERIAMVAYPTRSYLKEGENLYLRLTKDGVSVDPEIYLEK